MQVGKHNQFNNANIGNIFVNILLGNVLPLGIKINKFSVNSAKMSIVKQTMSSSNITVTSSENETISVDCGFYTFNGMDYLDMGGNTNLIFTGRKFGSGYLYKQTICLKRESSSVNVSEEDISHEYRDSSNYQYFSSIKEPVINTTAIGELITSLDLYYIELT